jgi:hypothetical protein
MGLCGVFWVAAYLLIIRRGFIDATHGMPIVALCANLSWEFIFSFVYPQRKQQLLINYSWLIFDLIILYQYLWFGLKLSIYKNNPLLFYSSFIILLIICYVAIVFITKKTNDYNHGKYAAFGQNLLMSMLFLYVLCGERSIEGQSVYIAITKMIGTVFSSVAFYMYFPRNVVLNCFYIFTFIFDLLYIVFLHEAILISGINPWERI